MRKDGMGWGFYLFAAVVFAPVTFVGMIGTASSGFCDTSCPSDRALTVYHLMFWGGALLFIASLLLAGVMVARRIRSLRVRAGAERVDDMAAGE